MICERFELLFTDARNCMINTADELLPCTTTTPELIEIPEGIFHTKPTLEDKQLYALDNSRYIKLF